MCDIKRFKQVLFNLVGNAVKFTFSGKIMIKISFDSKLKLIEGAIIDTGMGIH